MSRSRGMVFIVTVVTALVSASFTWAKADEPVLQVERGHWLCREIAALTAAYDVPSSVPSGAVVLKEDLAAALDAVLAKVLERCDKEGGHAVPAADLKRLAALHDALHEELSHYEGYLLRREAIEKMLARPETPGFDYKVGVGGFLRGEGSGSFRLTDSSHAPGHDEGRFLYRVKPYGYWHPTDWLDIHVEGQGYGFAGGDHQKYNMVSLYQGFVEARIPGREWLSVKAGRQEFSYGSTFILGADSFYDGLSFDAARVRLKPVEPLVIDLLAGAYATPFSGGVAGNLSGVYATYTISEGNAVEGYLFRDTGSTDHHGGEKLYTGGARFTGSSGPFTAEFEPVYQWGDQFSETSGGNERISAFGGHLDLTAETVLGGFNNKVFASYAYGSGSQDAANGIRYNREFRNPNNETSLVGDMSVVGDLSGLTVSGATGDHRASGLQIYTLGWGIDLTRELNFSATGRYFHANHVEEGFSRHLGLETDFTLTWAMSEQLSLVVGYDRFFTGGFFRDASACARDIDYGYAMLQFDLSRTRPKLKPGT